MNQTQIQELPNPGNDLTYVVQTAPGVVMNTDVQGLANFSILGMPGFSYLHTMDGMNDNDNGYNLSQVGALILLLGQNQIQEATVVSTGYSGQFGGAAGGNINYITKSGGNRFHGNAQYYWNGTAFDANDITDCAGFDVLLAGVPCSRHFLSTRGRPSQDTLVSGRIDWNVRSNDRAFLRLQYDRGHSAVFNHPISSLFDVDINWPWWQS